MSEHLDVTPKPESEIPSWVEVEHRIWPLTESPKPPWKINVLAAASHPGGIKALAPITDQLVKRGSRCTLITSRPITSGVRAEGATGIAEKFSFSATPDIFPGFPDKLSLSDKIPNLVLFSGTSGPEMEIELQLIQAAIAEKSAGKTIIIAGVEDDTPGLKPILIELHQRRVLLSDQISALYLASRLSQPEYQDQNFPDIPETKFITTGPPGFDEIHSENTQEVNTEIRQQLGISPTDIVIAHFAARSSDRWGAVEINATQAISSAAVRLAGKYPGRNFVFIHRLHPGEKDPRKLYEIIESLPNLVDNFRIIPHHQSSSFDTRLISAASHLSTSTLSITLTGVALRGARRLPYTYTGQTPLYYLSDGARGILTEVGYDIPPAAKLGAATTADNKTELIPIMEATLFDDEFCQNLFRHQTHEFRDAYRFKGRATATNRVILKIRSLLVKNNLLK